MMSAAYIQMHSEYVYHGSNLANNIDPDQTAPDGTDWSGFILFAIKAM